MSHRDGFSPDPALLGEVEAWAHKATGINATKARAKAQLADFKTRADMRFSSGKILKYRWKKYVREHLQQLVQIGFATTAKLQTV
jgi:hypothetical protein